MVEVEVSDKLSLKTTPAINNISEHVLFITVRRESQPYVP